LRRERSPEALEDADVRSELAEGWGVNATEMRYVPLGGGSYHWDVDAADGCRWFVSATDLDHAPWLGVDRPSSWRTLKATMSAAVALRREALAFVVAPLPCRDGGPTRLIRERYGLVVHPFLEGVCGEFGSLLHVETSDVIDIVVDLHAAPSAVVDLHELIDLKVRETLDPANPRFALIVRRYEEPLQRFAGRRLVITHGEPHAGNVMQSGDVTYLIDWDTAALALPERDLWLLLDHGHSDVLRLYEDRTGQTLDHEALALYRLRWNIEELIGAVRDLDAAATEHALANARAAAAL
jgi:spectinomycin phosphotransferase